MSWRAIEMNKTFLCEICLGCPLRCLRPLTPCFELARERTSNRNAEIGSYHTNRVITRDK